MGIRRHRPSNNYRPKHLRAECPECESPVLISKFAVEGQSVTCVHCGSLLMIADLDPLDLRAVEVEDGGWSEYDYRWNDDDEEDDLWRDYGTVD